MQQLHFLFGFVMCVLQLSLEREYPLQLRIRRGDQNGYHLMTLNDFFSSSRENLIKGKAGILNFGLEHSEIDQLENEFKTYFKTSKRARRKRRTASQSSQIETSESKQKPTRKKVIKNPEMGTILDLAGNKIHVQNSAQTGSNQIRPEAFKRVAQNYGRPKTFQKLILVPHSNKILSIESELLQSMADPLNWINYKLVYFYDGMQGEIYLNHINTANLHILARLLDHAI